MNIGEHEINGEELFCINKILSEFYNQETNLISGELPTGLKGRSITSGKNFRLEVSNGRFAGIKRKHRKNMDFDLEFLVKDVREILHMLNFCIKNLKGFPMDGITWKKTDCLLSDWGIKNSRVDLATMRKEQITNHELFLEQIGQNTALVILLGLNDRNKRNFVWDYNEETIISIDHEALTGKILDDEITGEINRTITKFCNLNWFDLESYQKKFSESFYSIWKKIIENQDEVIKIFKNYNLNHSVKLFKSRLEISPNSVLARIFM